MLTDHELATVLAALPTAELQRRVAARVTDLARFISVHLPLIH